MEQSFEQLMNTITQAIEQSKKTIIDLQQATNQLKFMRDSYYFDKLIHDMKPVACSNDFISKKYSSNYISTNSSINNLTK